MSELKLHSQVTPSDGGFQIEGWKKLVQGGQPWVTFFREVFQNSNDARVSKAETMTFTVDLSEITVEALEVITGPLQGELEISSSLSYDKLIRNSEVRMLVVADSNTLGLSGGTNPQTNTSHSRFSQFFFDLGRKEESSTSGGSFGFGRNVLFQASQVSTIVVFTRYREDGVIKARFMAMAAGKSVHRRGMNLTGLHWWGKDSNDSSVGPAVGPEAENLGNLFGLSEYLGSGTGTAIGILAPDENQGDILANLEACALLYAWPHMHPLDQGSGMPSVEFRFISEGMARQRLDPSSRQSPVSGFYHSYLASKGENVMGVESRTISLSQAPANALQQDFGLTADARNLGKLLWSSLPAGRSSDWPAIYREIGFTEKSQVALMRGVGIVVDYLEISSTLPDITTSGVFIVDPGYEQVFRKAENITHDCWEHTRLKLRGVVNPVKFALDALKREFAPRGFGGDGTAGERDLEFADFIGQFVDGLTITGRRIIVDPPPPPPSLPSGVKPSLKLAQTRVLKTDKAKGTASGEFLYSVTWPKATDRSKADQVWSFDFTPRVLAADGVEKSPPSGTEPPVVVGLSRDGVQEELSGQGTYKVNANVGDFHELGISVEFPLGVRIELGAVVGKVTANA